jgi:hypothetical protein
MTTFVSEATVEPDGYYQLTSLASAAGIGGGNGRVALIQCLKQNVRWRDDGVDPTANVGVRIHAGESIFYVGDLRKIRFIEEAASAELNISTYK